MKLSLGLTGLLLAALAVLALRTLVLDHALRDLEGMNAVLDEMELADININRDILRARSGLLKNYDPLVDESARIRALLARLRTQAGADAELAQQLRELDVAVRRNQERTESFKTQNALLTNSLAYFWRETERHIMDGPELAPDAAIPALASAIQRLTLDTSAATVAEARHRLTRVATCCGHASPADRLLLAHSRMLLDLLPQVDRTLSRLVPVSSTSPFASLRDLLMHRRMAAERETERMRTALMALTALLLLLVAYLSALLARWTRARRRRFRFERIMTQVSTRLVGGTKSELDGDIEAALDRVCAWLGAEQGYFVVVPADAPPRIWPRVPARFPQQALESLARAIAPLSTGPTDSFAIPSARTLTTEALQGMDAQAAARRWLLLPRRLHGGTQGLLAFERKDPAFRDAPHEYAMLHTLIDTITGALQRDRLQDDALRLERQLERARRMEAIGAMASGISHNFNNIVTAISANAEAAHSILDDGQPARHNVEEIKHAAERARTLIDEILGFGRPRNGAMAPVAIAALVRETLSLASASLPPHVRIQAAGDAGRSCVLGNAAQLQQVIFNLVNNAVQAMPGGGTIALSLSRLAQSAVAAAEPDGDPREWIRLDIADQGAGIPPDRLERIFRPFYTTRNGGTGLGLATAQQIVAEHEGHISVRSRLGTGTTFSVFLPLLAVGSEAAAPPLPSADGTAILLLAGDDIDLARSEDLLAALGCEPVGYTRMADAVQALGADPARFDGMLLQIADAAEALSAIRRLHALAPALPILLATSAGGLRKDAILASRRLQIIAFPPEVSEVAYAMQRLGLGSCLQHQPCHGASALQA